MSRTASLLILGVLLLGVGSIGATASPRSEWVVGRPLTADLSPAQYRDRGRCFNTCIAGRILRRCQVAGEGVKENCCNVSCNRLNNWSSD
jgi:hypothetical protein